VSAPLITQLDLPLEPVASLPRQGPASLERDGVRLLVHLVRVRSARRYVLRVRPDGALRVTIPPGGSRADAGVGKVLPELAANSIAGCIRACEIFEETANRQMETGMTDFPGRRHFWPSTR